MTVRKRAVFDDAQTMMFRAAAAIMLLLTAACATESHLSHDLEFCCGPKGPALATYSLTLVALPAFLAPALRGALVEALTAKGLRQSDKNPDALVTLSYAVVYTDSDRPLAHDGFADPLSVGGPRKFDARVTLDIRRASSGGDVLRGVLSREHKESVGEYGHERGRAQMRDGFDQLLKRLPTVPRQT